MLRYENKLLSRSIARVRYHRNAYEARCKIEGAEYLLMRIFFESMTISEILKKGGIAVIPTDTLYGIVASARIPKSVERVYRVRGRESGKPCIVLISDTAGLEEFGVALTISEIEFLKRYWPGAVSVVLSCTEERFLYLHRGTGTLAFRVPDNQWLREILQETGPLIAPSANPAGLPPATTIDEAKRYFHDQVDAYVDGGSMISESSTVVRLSADGSKVLRVGKVKI